MYHYWSRDPDDGSRYEGHCLNDHGGRPPRPGRLGFPFEASSKIIIVKDRGGGDQVDGLWLKGVFL